MVPLPDRALDFDLRVVPLRDAVNHGQAQAGAALALGGEERLQTAAAGFLVHADAGVASLPHATYASVFGPDASAALVRKVSVPPSGMASTALKTRLIERLANFAFDARDRRQDLAPAPVAAQ